MTRKGLAGKAVGAAVLCSAIGGTASALVMMAATEPLAQWAIRNIGPPEIFALVFFGLAVASSVGGNTIWKGWMSVLLGLLIATIGQDPVGGINRYNFGLAIWLLALPLFRLFLVSLPCQRSLFRRKKGHLENIPRQNSTLIFQRSGNYGVIKSPLCGQFLSAFSAVSCRDWRNTCRLYGLWRSGALVKRQKVIW